VNAKELCQQGDQLFGKRTQLMLLWQEIALNFYPERADFTYKRVVGRSSRSTSPRATRSSRAATWAMPSARCCARRRRRGFTRGTAHEGDPLDIEARRWLEWAETVQRRAMYDRATQFTRATKEGDHDFAAFGQCVISVELNRHADALLYRCWHLRDVAWAENEEGKDRPGLPEVEADGAQPHAPLPGQGRHEKVEQEPPARIPSPRSTAATWWSRATCTTASSRRRTCRSTTTSRTT
jgi:hypothetical protein